MVWAISLNLSFFLKFAYLISNAAWSSLYNTEIVWSLVDVSAHVISILLSACKERVVFLLHRLLLHSYRISYKMRLSRRKTKDNQRFYFFY